MEKTSKMEPKNAIEREKNVKNIKRNKNKSGKNQSCEKNWE